MEKWWKGKSRDGMLNFLYELRRRNLTTFQKLARNGKRKTKHSLRDRETSVFLGNRPETKEDQRQVKEPVRASQAIAVLRDLWNRSIIPLL